MGGNDDEPSSAPTAPASLPDAQLDATIQAKRGSSAVLLLPPAEGLTSEIEFDGPGYTASVTASSEHLALSVAVDADAPRAAEPVAVELCPPESGECSSTVLLVTVDVISAEADGESASVLRPSPQRVEITSPEEPAVVIDELIVYGVAGADAETVREAIRNVGGTVVGQLPTVGIFQARFDDPSQLSAVAVSLRNDSAVAATTPHVLAPRNVTVAEPTGSPNDWDDDEDDATWHHRLTGATEAWATGHHAGSVDVGIVDEALFPNHEDLVNVVATKFPEHHISPGSVGVRDDYAHGTHVAALACGEGGNDLGLLGTAWRCRLHTFDKWAEFRGIDAPDVSSRVYLPTHTSTLYTYMGILDVIDRGASVVNISLATSAPEHLSTRCTDPLTDTNRTKAAEAAAAQQIGYDLIFGSHPEVLFVIAAGNNCTTIDLVAPAGAALNESLSNVITVGSVDADRRVSAFSSFGEGVTLLAPGGFSSTTGNAVWSAGAFPCSTLGGCDSRYNSSAGTSQAAPQVTGAAAMILEQQPDAAPSEIIACLTTSPNRATGVSDNLVSATPARVADAEWAKATPILHVPTAIDCLAEPEPELITVQGVTYAEPLAGNWTPSDRARSIVAMGMGNSGYGITIYPGLLIDDLVASTEPYWQELVDEGFYDPSPHWYEQVEVQGADRAIRFTDPSSSGDGASDNLMIEVGNVTIEAYAYVYIEDLDVLGSADLAHFLDSIRVARDELPTLPTSSGSARCENREVATFGGSTEAGFDVVVCIDTNGNLQYHGVEVATGLEIRLSACQVADGLFAALDGNTLYLVDGRIPEAFSSDVSIYDESGSRYFNDLFVGVVGTGDKGQLCGSGVLDHPALDS
ncbi:MAG: S8/S53 family peptidase [Acidimicrobiales bacterium]